MRSIALVIVLLLGLAAAAGAQATANESHSGDLAAAYHWVHTNSPPNGGCGCFALNGIGVSGSYDLRSRLSIAAEASLDHTSSALAANNSLTLTSFMAGPRLHLPDPFMRGPHALQPFTQLIVGFAHAGGGIAGVADGTSAFAGRLGGGLDLPVSGNLVVRVIEADYYMTTFANTVDNRQNNTLIGAGVALRWQR